MKDIEENIQESTQNTPIPEGVPTQKTDDDQSNHNEKVIVENADIDVPVVNVSEFVPSDVPTVTKRGRGAPRKPRDANGNIVREDKKPKDDEAQDTAQNAQIPPNAKKLNDKGLAILGTSVLVVLMRVLGGDKVPSKTDKELKDMSTAFEAYFATLESTPSPAMALMFASVAFVSPAIVTHSEESLIAKMKRKIFTWFAG